MNGTPPLSLAVVAPPPPVQVCLGLEFTQEHAAVTNGLLQAEVCRRRVSPANRYVFTSVAGPLVHFGVAIGP